MKMLKNKNKNISEVGEKRTRTSTRVNACGAYLIKKYAFVIC